jgi:hypothetical protein
MEGIITVDGHLQIKRGKEFKLQYCPLGSVNNVVCGDWCSLFGEIINENPNNREITKYHYNSKLSLCKKELFFDKITDDKVK